MSVSQADKAKKFRALHEAPGAFVIANPWDGGSARLLAGLGFQALATSSGAKAGVLGKRDGKVTREEALANARMIVEACDLPVSADLEKGFGDGPDAAGTHPPGGGHRAGRRSARAMATRTSHLRHPVRLTRFRRREAARASFLHPHAPPFCAAARLDDVIRRLQVRRRGQSDVAPATSPR